jgi:thiosulfate/3-mercaptopyruvate sulfurtransferase
MEITLSPLIQASELLKLHASEHLIIVDVSNGTNAKSNYDAKHLEGALFVDLNSQLADIKQDLSIGGRHPLPKMEDFLKTVAHLGISPKSHIVVYDDKKGSNAAARFWWMLKAIGHENVQVLNGGFQEAEKHHFPLSSKASVVNKTELYKVDHWKLKMAVLEEVEKISQTENYIIIDVRAAERYSGENEPIDPVAGHIRGAINVPFTENLDENGLFLSPHLLHRKYTNVFGTLAADHIIVYCGSGVTACHSLLAIAYAGLELPRLYVGSWSEWSRNNKMRL